MQTYEKDINAWASEQANLLRAGQYGLLPRWLDMVWAKAVAQAVNETGLDCFPDVCPWSLQKEALSEKWMPGMVTTAPAAAHQTRL